MVWQHICLVCVKLNLNTSNYEEIHKRSTDALHRNDVYYPVRGTKPEPSHRRRHLRQLDEEGDGPDQRSEHHHQLVDSPSHWIDWIFFHYHQHQPQRRAQDQDGDAFRPDPEADPDAGAAAEETEHRPRPGPGPSQPGHCFQQQPQPQRGDQPQEQQCRTAEHSRPAQRRP